MTLDDLVVKVGNCTIQCDNIMGGYIETVDSIADKTVFKEVRKMHMGDAKSIAKTMKFNLVLVLEELEKMVETKGAEK